MAEKSEGIHHVIVPNNLDNNASIYQQTGSYFYVGDGNNGTNMSVTPFGGGGDYPGSANDYQSYVRAYYEQSTEYRVHRLLVTYAYPLLLALGTLGNLLAFCVLRRRLARQHSVYFYLATYTIVCTLTLALTCGLDWIAFVTDTNSLPQQADWLCRLCNFIFSVIRYGGSWLMILMVFDRFVYVCLPGQSHSVCSVFSAKVFTCLACVMLVAVGIHAMWTYELMPDRTCNIPHRRDFQTVVWPIIAACIHIYLPIMCILIFDLVIILNLAVLSARQYQSRNFSPVQQQLTRAVLVLSLTFSIINLPHLIINLIDFIHPPSLFSTYPAILRFGFTSFICSLLVSAVLALNLPLYALALPVMRAEFKPWARQLVVRGGKGMGQADSSGALTHVANGDTKHNSCHDPLIDKHTAAGAGTGGGEKSKAKRKSGQTTQL